MEPAGIIKAKPVNYLVHCGAAGSELATVQASDLQRPSQTLSRRVDHSNPMPRARATSPDFFILLSVILAEGCSLGQLDECLLVPLQVEAIEVHDLRPGLDKITYEFLVRVVRCVDFSNGPQLRARSE